MSFYQIPKYIFNPIADRKICSGKILLPLDHEGQLQKQLDELGFKETYKADCADDHLDLMWWKSVPQCVWVVAVTQGVPSTIDWVLYPGYEVARKGVIILDRITFLEPTKQRAKFLQEKPLSNLIVLNPRPEFRADQNKSKDSVTSAWFVFNKTKSSCDQTEVEFDVSWQRPKTFL